MAAEKIEVGDLEVAPIMAEVPPVAGTIAVRKPTHQATERPRHPGRVDPGLPEVAVGDTLGFFPVRYLPKESRTRLLFLPERYRETVYLLMAGHLDEGIVGDGAGKLDIRF